MSRSTSSQDGLLQFTTADDCTSSSISDMQSSLNSESSTLERKLQEAITLHGPLHKKKNVTSTVWNYFLEHSDTRYVNCKCCSSSLKWVSGTNDKASTSILTRHLQIHPDKYKALLENKVDQEIAAVAGIEAQRRALQDYIATAGQGGKDETKLRWLVNTYQPYATFEDESFRAMIQAENPKAAPVSIKYMKTLVSEKQVALKKVVDNMISGQKGALTTDGWTSKRNQSYYAFTFHYIDKDFKMISIPIGIEFHTGTATAEDHLAALETELARHGLSWENVVALVTDTEATMNKTGRLLCSHAKALGTEVEHVGCIDHILNTVTKRTAVDADVPMPPPEEAGALKVARALVGSFKASSQLSQKLTDFQRSKNPVVVLGLIQDVITRWWSTFSMVERLIRLKADIDWLAAQADTNFENLNPAQWKLLRDIETILRPFMLAQKLLEGEKYVTISMVPYIVTKIRNGLVVTAAKRGNSEYVIRMLEVLTTAFNNEFGSGDVDTVFTEHETLGKGNRHKGLRVVHMISAYLDPRTRDHLLTILGPGDQELLAKELKRRALIVAEELHLEKNVARAAAAATAAVAPAVAVVRRRGMADNYADIFDDLDNLGVPTAAEPILDADALYLREVFDAVENELRMYAGHSRLDRTKRKWEDEDGNQMVEINDPLSWWNGRVQMMPILSLLVRRTLCVPATSAPSERLFSAAGLTIANDRAGLTPDNASDLIFLKGAWSLVESHIIRKRAAETDAAAAAAEAV